MDIDDAPVGRILSRREILALFGAAGAGVLSAACSGSGSNANRSAATTADSGTSAPAAISAGGPPGATNAASATSTSSATATALPACVVVPELTEGPYFVDEKLNRSDIRTDSVTRDPRPGVPLVITFNVLSVNGSACAALPKADLDIWHCDAAGRYSDTGDMSASRPGEDWLRGYQPTDDLGVARFTTVYPGWYPGRAVHIHFKVRGTTPAGKTYEFTSQLFFDEATTDVVYVEQPYAARRTGRLKNDGDGIYRQSGGKTLMPVTKTADGYTGSFVIGIQGV